MSVQTALMKLDIGCGIFKRDGYTGVDIDPICHPDICAPMNSIPLPDNSVSEIYSSHALEHQGKFEIVPILKEWKRILIPGGTLVIEVPDLRWCVQNWLFRQTNDWHLDALFGQQTGIGEFHKTGFTPRIMEGYIEEAGLVVVDQTTIDSHGQPTLQFFVEKER